VRTTRHRVRRRGNARESGLMEDRCPGVLRLHAAADGHLLRVRVPGGRVTPEALRTIADLGEMGNGLVEVTSRASVQIRGMRERDAGHAAERLSSAGLLPSPDHDRVRNILASPLGGRDTAALMRTDELVEKLDRDLCRDPALVRLPGRFLFALEDGAGIVGGRQADVTLAAEPNQDGEGLRLRLHLAGAPTTRTASPARAAHLALETARAFLTVLDATAARARDRLWRVADLSEVDVTRLLGEIDAELVPGPALSTGRPPRLGTGRLAGGSHAITALAPLGRLTPETARELAALGESESRAVRLSPWRTVSVVDLHERSLRRVASRLTDLGLVIDEDSGWQGLTACAGLGACANARIDVRGAAAARATVRGANGTSVPEHWSGCERRCGRPAVVARAATATGQGIDVECDGATHRADDVFGALDLLAAGGAAHVTTESARAAGGWRA
jgi:sulfite reductase beta subunit-like hemoprotein